MFRRVERVHHPRRDQLVSRVRFGALKLGGSSIKMLIACCCSRYIHRHIFINALLYIC